MANHKSALKRIRQNRTRRENNRYFAKTARNAIKVLRNVTDKEEAAKMFPGVVAKIDKLAKKNIIHKNKASNLKSKLSAHVSSL